MDVEEVIDAIPEACQSTCDSTVPIVRKCYDKDLEGCLEVCTQSNYDGFIDCQNCALREDGRTFTATEVAIIRRAMRQIEQGCRARGNNIDFKQL